MEKMYQCCVPADPSPRKHATRVHKKSSQNTASYSIFNRIAKDSSNNKDSNSFEPTSGRREFLKDLISNLHTSFDSTSLNTNIIAPDAIRTYQLKQPSQMHNKEFEMKEDIYQRNHCLLNSLNDPYATKSGKFLIYFFTC